ncbi:hypothetical protein [Pseudomonas aeruginosa]|uniref:hypothetical protein n=1 Tax=Pseudomonas aeruginosa TaxID=287 RepID=UPI0034E0C20D
MTHLAFNTVLPKGMRAKYQLAIGALPIGLMFLSFVPLFFFAAWLEAALGIPHNSPIKNHPNGTIWITTFLAVMVILMLSGYALGWLLNSAVARYVFGWTSAQVAAVFGRSEVPSHWLKNNVPGATESEAISTQLSKWEEQRKSGALRFIVMRGVGAWGIPMFLGMYVGPTIAKHRGFTLKDILFNTALWLIAGALFGAFIWFLSERNYRTLRGRK